MPASQLEAWVRSANFVLAADGAYDRLKEIGFEPNLVVGDMDSISGIPSENSVLDSDQDSSDCDKLLAYATKLGHSEITLVSIEGDRTDHLLGTLGSCLRSPLTVRLALRTGAAWVLRGPCYFRLNAARGDILSLMPVEACQGVDFSGVEWPLVDVEMAPSLFVSLSNRAVEDQVEVRLGEGSAVLFHISAEAAIPSW